MILNALKVVIGTFILAIATIACTQQTDYKVVRDDVIKFHDVIMTDQGVIINNQMKLDTLLKNLKGLKARFPDIDTLKEKKVITGMIAELSRAQKSMDDWMHKFEPDVTGESNEAAVQYFKDEKLKIAAIDSLYKKEIESSTAYLSKFRK